MNLVKYCMCM